MFGIFDPLSVSRHERTIDFVAISGDRHTVSLRTPAMADRVRECVRDQLRRRITSAEIETLQDGRVSLSSAGIAIYQGTLVRNDDGHVLHCKRVQAGSVKVRHDAIFPIDFEGDVAPITAPMMAVVEGYLTKGRIKGFRAAVSSGAAPQPEDRPAAE